MHNQTYPGRPARHSGAAMIGQVDVSGSIIGLPVALITLAIGNCRSLDVMRRTIKMTLDGNPVALHHGMAAKAGGATPCSGCITVAGDVCTGAVAEGKGNRSAFEGPPRFYVNYAVNVFHW